MKKANIQEFANNLFHLSELEGEVLKEATTMRQFLAGLAKRIFSRDVSGGYAISIRAGIISRYIFGFVELTTVSYIRLDPTSDWHGWFYLFSFSAAFIGWNFTKQLHRLRNRKGAKNIHRRAFRMMLSSYPKVWLILCCAAAWLLFRQNIVNFVIS